jgi:hypothetical protein
VAQVADRARRNRRGARRNGDCGRRQIIAPLRAAASAVEQPIADFRAAVAGFLQRLRTAKAELHEPKSVSTMALTAEC